VAYNSKVKGEEIPILIWVFPMVWVTRLWVFCWKGQGQG